MLPVFSSKRKNKISTGGGKQTLPAFQKAYETNPYFDVEFSPCKDGENILVTTENLVHFPSVLGQWYGNSDNLVQEEGWD
ncbi:MAG: hypothetical protein IPM82_21420 [Saprospiraceae bacterium]|nr:hypothetical protein [Saprospiraceae bacterium]